jgi:PGF-CTERM protein
VGASHVASTSISERTTGGHTVIVDEVYLPEGGFVAIHDSSLTDGGADVLASVRGMSGYLEPGNHSNLTVTLDDPLEEDETLFAMPHTDTNGDRTYSFVGSGGEADGPSTTEADDDGTDTPGSNGDGAGFGAVVALVAIVGSLLAARRLD